MLKFYWAKGTISIAVAVALEESGLPYQPIEIDFASAEQTKPEYLAINPKGRVPALVTADSTVLTEAGALLEYIGALAPEKALVPQDPLQAAHMRSVMFYIASTMHVAHSLWRRGNRWADQQSSWDDMAAKVASNMATCAAYIQSDCLRGTFVLGDRFCIADAYVYRVCSWLEMDGVATADFPAITTFLKAMEARDSIKALRDKGIL